MNIIKSLEKLVKIKDELHQIRKQIENNEREIDYAVSEIIEFLKHKQIIETRTVR